MQVILQVSVSDSVSEAQFFETLGVWHTFPSGCGWGGTPHHWRGGVTRSRLEIYAS